MFCSLAAVWGRLECFIIHGAVDVPMVRRPSVVFHWDVYETSQWMLNPCP